MTIVVRKHWSYHEISDNERLLEIFGTVGLKKGAQVFMGSSREALFESNCAYLASTITEEIAQMSSDRGSLSSIRLNSYTAMMLFFENALTFEILRNASEDDSSIIAKLFNVRLVIKENPASAIAYIDISGNPIRV